MGFDLPALAAGLLRFRQSLSRACLLPLIMAAMVLAGCASKYPRLEVMAPLPDAPHCRVAVLPLFYQGDFPQGENIVYKAFFAEIAAVSGFEMIPEGDVLQLYRQFRLYPKDRPNEEQLRVLAERLGAEILVTGDILRMSEEDIGGEVGTELTLVLGLHAGASGKLLWSTYHRRQGEEYRNLLHYGRVNTMSGLARRMANEIISLWIENGMKQCTQ